MNVQAVAVADLGADLPSEWFKASIARACGVVSVNDLKPLLAEHCADAEQVALHVPWVAWALDNYRQAQQRRKPEAVEAAKARAEMQGREYYPLDFSSANYAELLKNIAGHAKRLYDALQIFEQRVSAAASNSEAWPIYLGASRDILQEFGDASDGRDNLLQWTLGLLALQSGAESGFHRIVGAEASGLTVAERLAGKRSRFGIAARRGERFKGLDSLVFFLGRVWLSMTARQPSAARVGPAGDEPSRFVRFVCAAAETQGLPQPTILQVKGALDRTFRSPPAPAQKCGSTDGVCI